MQCWRPRDQGLGFSSETGVFDKISIFPQARTLIFSQIYLSDEYVLLPGFWIFTLKYTQFIQRKIENYSTLSITNILFAHEASVGEFLSFLEFFSFTTFLSL